jgi:hypothetical protein
MNGYTKILLASVVLLIISIINENNIHMDRIIWSNPTLCEFFCIYFIRSFHYFIFLYSSFYLFFFHGIGQPLDVYIYLLAGLCILLGWYAFECCWASYIELLYYRVDVEKIDTKFHPTFYSVFEKYTSNIMKFAGILYLFTVSYVLYSTKSIHMIYKILYYIIFLWLFLNETIFCKVRTYSAKKNKQLSAIKKTYDNYLSKICSCSK